MSMMREVWQSNLAEELALISECFSSCPFIAIHTVLPGCLKNTPMNGPESYQYEDMKFSVDRTKIIQLGFTLFDSDCRIGGTWEVNFSGFSEIRDARNRQTISFLKHYGLDFERIRQEGVCVHDFFPEFLRILRSQQDLLWVTFHGSYHIAHLVKMLTQWPIPDDLEEFTEVVGKTLGRLYDMKAMASRVRGLNEWFGLERLASELGVSRQGSAHHAGSDSLLSARAFMRMAARCKDLSGYEGFVYGIRSPIVSTRVLPQAEPPSTMTTVNMGRQQSINRIQFYDLLM